MVYHKVYSFLKAIACRGLADARALERGPIRCDLVEFDYAAIAKAMGSHAIRVSDPETVAETLREGLANTSSPTIIDLIVTRDPARMLPGVDNRTLKVQKGDRPCDHFARSQRSRRLPLR